MIRVALIGFGGIAQLHRYAYWYHNRAGMPVQLVAASDPNPAAFEGVTKINLAMRGEIVDELPFAKYSDWRQMIAEQKPDLVDICVPTLLHEEITIEALKAGCDVLCEKPMATAYEPAKRMADAATECGRALMIGQCVRFYPQYIYLRKAVQEGRYGKVLSASFTRVSPIPTWGGANWRRANIRNGSSIMDLNIHDIDVMQYIFGMPTALSCQLESRTTPYDYSLSRFDYGDCTVEIDSAWLDEKAAFNMSYAVEFEKGTLRFDGEAVTFTADGITQDVAMPGADGITTEIEYFIDILANNKPNAENPPEQTVNTMYLLEKCFESGENGGITLEVLL